MAIDRRKYPKTIVLPISMEMWRSLRKISFDREVSMSQMARDSLEKIVQKFEKDVDLNL